MPKLVVWTFALCTVLLPLGRASAKPRGEPEAELSASVVRESKAPARESSEPKAAPPSKTVSSAKSAKKGKRGPKVIAPCFAPEVHVARRRGDLLEHRDLALTFCDGSPNPSALDSVSVLARPRDAERPLMPEIRAYQKRPLDRGPKTKRRQPEYLS